MTSLLKKYIPESIQRWIQPTYHWTVALLSTIWYRFPSHKIKVVAVTGTKGKTTTTELVSTLLEAGGYKTAIISTLRFKTADKTHRNLLKMTTPGRGAIQKILREAVNAGCDYAVLELSSEGAKQHRHAFISLDGLIFTNLSPEHIESHGSYENYVGAKLSLAKALESSSKPNKVIVANADDSEASKFLSFDIERKLKFSIKDAEPYQLSEDGSFITLDKTGIKTKLPGLFNIYNILAASTYAKSQGIKTVDIKNALEKFEGVLGRMQKVYSSKFAEKQNFDVIVDYAHTADSLKAAYGVYAGKRRMICVLGCTGGGRDKWKRSEMGKVANDYCEEVILTNDDPYEEDPDQIVCDMAKGIEKNYDIIIDRKEAIREAISRAKPGDVIMLTGKGTDPYLMEAGGKKTPWSDAGIATEELDRYLSDK
jgi:UDP-N-acetylmuramoyl-L-alanyl-D-glutamate--2,6-diaminopimelate ligase